MPRKPLHFDWDAIEEARDAYRLYHERSASAAVRFLNELDAAVVAIENEPKRFGLYVHGCRRRKPRRFPYLVIFREAEDKLLVVAVAHAHRRPGYWKDRLQ